MLALSAGVQQWVEGADVTIPLKTSPSGGARHAIECYVVARDVRGTEERHLPLRTAIATG